MASQSLAKVVAFLSVVLGVPTCTSACVGQVGTRVRSKRPRYDATLLPPAL